MVLLIHVEKRVITMQSNIDPDLSGKKRGAKKRVKNNRFVTKLFDLYLSYYFLYKFANKKFYYFYF